MVIRTLLREGAIDHEGRFYAIRDSELLPRGSRAGGPPLARIDAACEAVGRDPATLGKTLAALVRCTGGRGRKRGGDVAAPLTGEPEEIADGLRVFACHGISHLQLVLDPITVGAIGELMPVLELLDQG
jgi:alkanesulfonate monooxygenase SsuD/methylene tetrahydromethanopterin reductase-like flavin-dependent oxidoreductase (luciferase family)